MTTKICGAKNRQGSPCQKFPLRGRTRCRLHGGLTPRGIASPHFKTGRYSNYLPDRLVSDYERLAGEAGSLDFREELAVVEARLSELMCELHTVTERSDEERQVWKLIREFIMLRRTLVIAEVKGLKETGQMISKEQLMILLAAFTSVIRDRVPDLTTRAALMEELRKLFDRGKNERVIH